MNMIQRKQLMNKRVCYIKQYNYYNNYVLCSKHIGTVLPFTFLLFLPSKKREQKRGTTILFVTNESISAPQRIRKGLTAYWASTLGTSTSTWYREVVTYVVRSLAKFSNIVVLNKDCRC